MLSNPRIRAVSPKKCPACMLTPSVGVVAVKAAGPMFFWDGRRTSDCRRALGKKDDSPSPACTELSRSG